jgi:hypothetical protein
MRRPLALALTVCAALAGRASPAGAQVAPIPPPRDYFLNPPPAGHFAHLDAYTIGAQASYEYRAHLEEDMSMFHARASAVVSYPYTEASANVDTRVFLFTLGASYGYRWVYRNHTFLPNETDRSADRRNDLESDKQWTDQDFTFYEGRLRLTIPLDSFFMANTATLRNEEQDDNSFDWFHANVHDGGTFTKLESTLFFRHRDFGAIGPYLRYMNLPRTDPATGESRREDEIAYGIVFGTRPGFVKPIMGNTDLFLFQAIFRFGDDDFGLHAYRNLVDVPMSILAVYRVTFGLHRSYPTQ